jgi:hypothetical protein
VTTKILSKVQIGILIIAASLIKCFLAHVLQLSETVPSPTAFLVRVRDVEK